MASPWRYLDASELLHYELFHYGIQGQKWGIRRGPPYPLTKFAKSLTNGLDRGKIVKEAIQSGSVKMAINKEKQLRHIAGNKSASGRSYIFGDLGTAQDIVDKYSGTGRPLTSFRGKWLNKEKIMASKVIGVHVTKDGQRHRTRYAEIIYSKTGTHVVPCNEDTR